MSSAMRRVVGIDLGTTHTALAHAALDGDAAGGPQVLPVPQLVAPGQLQPRPLLPSAVYLPNASEFPAGAIGLPWHPDRAYVVGEFARSHGAQVASRLVTSAKSWLSFAGADRRARILPWNAPDDVAKISPVDASARYLQHLAESFLMATGQRLVEQEVVLTVPASFDAVARELTLEAARAAGLNPTLLEEPQAAMYAWLAAAGDGWRQRLKVGDVVLVVDVGGGTTDFSLMAVGEQEGNLALRRVAVGDHLLLGGDNMDLALAYQLKQRLQEEGRAIDAWQFQALVHGCRVAKEALLSDPALPSHVVVIPGRGSGLVGGAIRTELPRVMLDVLVEGFFPAVNVTDAPKQGRRSALADLNLPYAADAAITRHLAAFLCRHSGALEEVTGASTGRPFVHPTAVLFNGGVMKSELLRRRIVETVSRWVEQDGGTAPQVLEGPDLDLAVARGAAYYGQVRMGRGVRIRGGTARAYYVGVESALPAVPGFEPPVTAVCVAPFGLEEGSAPVRLERQLGLVVGEPASFRFFASSVRRGDGVGQEVSGDSPQLEELSPIETVLGDDGSRPGGLCPVQLEARVTELGTLALECVERAGPGRWKLEFNVRPGA